MRRWAQFSFSIDSEIHPILYNYRTNRLDRNSFPDLQFSPLLLGVIGFCYKLIWSFYDNFNVQNTSVVSASFELSFFLWSRVATFCACTALLAHFLLLLFRIKILIIMLLKEIIPWESWVSFCSLYGQFCQFIRFFGLKKSKLLRSFIKYVVLSSLELFIHYRSLFGYFFECLDTWIRWSWRYVIQMRSNTFE